MESSYSLSMTHNAMKENENNHIGNNNTEKTLAVFKKFGKKNLHQNRYFGYPY